MLADFFAPANRMTTILCIVAFVLMGVIQYWLCLRYGHSWLRRLPVLVCAGAAVLFLALFFFVFSRNSWHALSWLFYMLFALLLLIACGIGWIAAHFKQRGKHKRTPHT